MEVEKEYKKTLETLSGSEDTLKAEQEKSQ